ncbi:kinase-like domain-containing protein [Zychaea mexicana]|uniref:kinase-like domain-containing protein n=1 Tax=Zychaea mexicana TaxID=64656 RepID=UPI0022FEDEC1|nr:kinase-like domain-containing protein [Zychaea mexicana]KAI9497653.1 kinase-like domain-containing protein [Zychaea mexicana]
MLTTESSESSDAPVVVTLNSNSSNSSSSNNNYNNSNNEQHTNNVSRSSSFHHSSSQQKRSIGSAADIFNSLKISTTVQHQDQSTPASPIPSATDSQVVIQSIDDFVIKGAIGYGSSAVVYSAIYTPLNHRVALKMIDLDMFERNQIDELRRETTLMALSKHPNVLRVLGSFVHGSKLYIVTPYLAGGSCLDIMKTNFREGLDELSIATILKQALEALAYLHKNGHIHRDVKAGNLLMDEDGTVLLADFGVSSSLMDTGDRGVRKTFVGTPCWMAPEVMEQAGYDYKADIWSFGITAIELATGHAPFAKLPPLKVLMMTLSSDPPTLVRETTKHKYSRVFKDMIDLCLNKDPSKRPTAEKLLQHQFFKQAKRRDYLVKTLLTDLPALEQRPHKKIPQRQISITKTDEWDFQDDDVEEESKDKQQQQQQQQQQQSTSQQQQQQQQVQGGRRHISFGDVVVKNPPQPYAASVQAEVVAPTKKSRFVVEETSREQVPSMPAGGGGGATGDLSIPCSRQASVSETNNSPMLAPLTDNSSDEGVKKGRFSVNKQSEQQQQQQQQQQDKPHQQQQQLQTADSTASSTSSDKPISKSASHDNIAGTLDRKSRFEVHHGDHHQATTTSTTSSSASPQLSAVAAVNNLSLSRDNSLSSVNGHALTRDGSSHSRLPARYQPLTDTKDDHSRKVGRFELSSESGRPSGAGGGSGASNNNEKSDVLHPYEYSSSSSTSPSSSLSRGQLLRLGSDQALPTFQTHMEELIKVNETQRNLLQELSGILKSTTSSTTTASSSLSSSIIKKSGSSDTQERPNSNMDELLSTVDTLETQLQASMRENQSLQRENEALRREIENIRTSSSGGSSSSSSAAGGSANKT